MRTKRLATLAAFVSATTVLGLAACAQTRSIHEASSHCGGTHEGDVWIRNDADFDALRSVETLRGTLRLGGEPSWTMAVADGQLDCLSRIEGSLLVGGLADVTSGPIELASLTRVDGAIGIGFVTDTPQAPAALSFPSLTTIGTAEHPDGSGLQVLRSQLREGIHVPALRTVYGLVSIRQLDGAVLDLGALRTVTRFLTLGPGELKTLRLDALRDVADGITFQELQQLPFSQIDGIIDATQPSEHPIAKGIGCARDDGDVSPDCDWR